MSYGDILILIGLGTIVYKATSRTFDVVMDAIWHVLNLLFKVEQWAVNKLFKRNAQTANRTKPNA